MIQYLYKKKDRFNAKLRRRKYKLRVYNKNIVPSASYNKTISPFPWLYSLRVKHACRLKFKTFIGTEKSLMVTKGKVWIQYNKYPNFFVTKKSSKSRMGKGKGKIVGRILKIQKGETIFNLHLANFFKTKRWLKALKGTLPSKTTLVMSSWGARKFYHRHYSNRATYYRKFRRKKKKRPFWMKFSVGVWEVAKRTNELYAEDYFYIRRVCRYYLNGMPKHLRKVNLSKGMRALTRFFFKRRYHFNSFGINRTGTQRKKSLNLKKYRLASKKNRYRILRIMSTARRRSYFNRKETMFYVLKSLNLDVNAPDVDGYTGMARYMNFMESRTLKMRLMRARAGLPEIE